MSDDRIPYQKPQPWGMAPDMVHHDVMTQDERLWAPIAPGIWSRPIHLNVTGGFYVHLLRVKRSGLLQRHRHSGQVHAYVMRASGAIWSTTGWRKRAVTCSSRQAKRIP